MKKRLLEPIYIWLCHLLDHDDPYIAGCKERGLIRALNALNQIAYSPQPPTNVAWFAHEAYTEARDHIIEPIRRRKEGRA